MEIISSIFLKILKIIKSFNSVLFGSQTLPGRPVILVFLHFSWCCVTPSSPGMKGPSIRLPPYSHINTHKITHTLLHIQIPHHGKIVLIYRASRINYIISNNCQRQLGSRLGDFILIDFLTSSELWMI